MERLEERALEMSIQVAKAYLRNNVESGELHQAQHSFLENRRYEIAKSALQGIISNALIPVEQQTFTEAARLAVKYADALISELMK